MVAMLGVTAFQGIRDKGRISNISYLRDLAKGIYLADLSVMFRDTHSARDETSTDSGKTWIGQLGLFVSN